MTTLTPARLRLPLLGLLLWGSACSGPPPQPPARPKAELRAGISEVRAQPRPALVRRVDRDYRDVSLREAIIDLAVTHGFQTIVLRSIPEARVTCSFRGVPWEVALDRVLRRAGCEGRPLGYGQFQIEPAGGLRPPGLDYRPQDFVEDLGDGVRTHWVDCALNSSRERVVDLPPRPKPQPLVRVEP